jgi:hypothetical protein
MKWKTSSKAPETARDKIEIIVANFDAFIRETHGPSDAKEDERVFKEWR